MIQIKFARDSWYIFTKQEEKKIISHCQVSAVKNAYGAIRSKMQY